MEIEGRYFTLRKTEDKLSWETYFHEQAIDKIKKKAFRNITLSLLFLVFVFLINQLHVLLYLFYLAAWLPVYVIFRPFSIYLGKKDQRKIILKQSVHLEPINGFPKNRWPWYLIPVSINYFLWAFIVRSNVIVEQTVRQHWTWYLIPLLVLYPIGFALKDVPSVYRWVHRGSLSHDMIHMNGHFYMDYDESIYLDPEVYKIGWYEEHLNEPYEDKLVFYYMSSFRRYSIGYFPFTNEEEYRQLLETFSEMAEEVGLQFVQVRSLTDLPGPARMI